MMNKKIVALLTLTVLLVLPKVAMAWTVKSVVDNVVGMVEIAFGAGLLIYFLWYGILFLKAKGDPTKVKEAKQALLWGIVGAIVGGIALTIIDVVTDTFGL